MKTVTTFHVFKLCSLIILSSVLSARAEVRTDTNYYHKLRLGPYAPTSTGYSGTGSNIDIIYQRCDWTIDPTVAKRISGTVTITFVTKAPIAKVDFDLNSVYNNTALIVKYKGSSVTKFFAGNVLNITLPETLATNSTASIEISYSGVPPAVNGQAEGYQRKQDAAGNWYIYTLSESYEDHDWWPCKADMQDKIDQMDINISVPDGYQAVTNGKLISSNTVSDGFRIFKYQLKYPIATYLVAVGVAKYNVYNRTVSIGGTNVPIIYYLFPGKRSSTYTNICNNLDKATTQLINFSSIFGDYPFKDEKHGYYEFGWGGGMEHQSISAMGSSVLTSWSTIAHELAHQWFGDKVTFATWNHLWLAEGFARYCEALALELNPSVSTSETPATVRKSFKDDARVLSETEVYIPNTYITSSNTLWNSSYGSSVYEKGAMVVSMLRKLVGDAKFYEALRNYLNDPILSYKSAVTEDLRRHFEAVTKYDLAPFFDEWVYKKGHADYPDIQWGKNGNRITIKLGTQTRSTGSNSTFFPTPVVLVFKHPTIASQDLSVVIYDQNGKVSLAGDGITATVSGDVLSFNLNFSPTSVQVDPYHETMAIGTATYNSTLDDVEVLLDVNIHNFRCVSSFSSNLLQLSIEPTNEDFKAIIERSDNGVHFSILGDMKIVATSDKEMILEYTDENFSRGGLYYRAKTIDERGVIKYSRTVRSAHKFINRDLQIVPNPANDKINMMLPHILESKKRRIRIYNTMGGVVKEEAISHANNQVQVSILHLPAGKYIVELIGADGERFVQSLTIAR